MTSPFHDFISSLRLWVAASLISYVLAANLQWVLRVKFGARARALMRSAVWQVVAALARIAYFVLVPYAALIAGAASPQLFALTRLDDFAHWESGLLIALFVFIGTSFVLWLAARYALAHYPPHVLPAARRRAQISQPWGFAFVLLDTLCLQAHWAFYRAGTTILLHDTASGALAGAALVLVEWLLDPAWRQQIRRPGQAEDALLIAVLALVTLLLALAGVSFWLMLIAHAALWLGWLMLMQAWYRPLAQFPLPYETGTLSTHARDA